MASCIKLVTHTYTPQQNGLSERMNRTLIERAKCMILNANLQNCYWAEAIATAAHIINRSPTRALNNITPEEVWTNKKPDLSHLRIFGCKAMVHIPKECRQKLDKKSRELIFVGYSDSTKGYRFIDPKSKQAIMSRDVVFLEATLKQNRISAVPEKEENTHNVINQDKIKEKDTKELKEDILPSDVHVKNNIIYLPMTVLRIQETMMTLDNYHRAQVLRTLHLQQSLKHLKICLMNHTYLKKVLILLQIII